MFSYVFMKILEMKPTTYDRHMDRASRSHVLEAKRAIVKEVTPGSYVLDVGCGTGDLARMMIERTCIVDGFDMNPAMVMAAGERIKTEHLEGKFSARQRGVEGMDGIATETYDAIVSTLVFSELNDDEKCFALQQAQRILRPEGIIIIADEVVPQTWCRRILHSIIRLPLFAITYVIATNATNPLADLAGEMTRAGFTIEKEVRSHGGHSPWSWAGKKTKVKHDKLLQDDLGNALQAVSLSHKSRPLWNRRSRTGQPRAGYLQF